MTDNKICVQILTLTNPIEFTWKIRPVCLPSDPSVIYEGKIVKATGWGRTDRRNTLPTNLMKADVKVITIQTCQNYYSSVTRYIYMINKNYDIAIAISSSC